MKKYRSFLHEIFQFLEVKISIYLNRCVFEMYSGFDVNLFKLLEAYVKEENVPIFIVNTVSKI